MFKDGKSFVSNFVKKYSYWFIAGILLLASSVLLSIDPYLTISELLYKTGVSLYVLTLAYTVRRTVLGYVKWDYPYDRIYAIAILLTIALIFTFVSLPQVSFSVVNK